MSDLVYMAQPKRPEVVENRMPSAEQHCRELYGFSKDWQVCAWHVKGDGAGKYLELTGGIYPETYKSGKRKGQTNYRKPQTESMVSLANMAHEAWLVQWERETGYCAACEGTGHERAGWNHIKGCCFRPCQKCDATGTAKQTAEAAA